MSAQDCLEWQNRFVMNSDFEWVLPDEEEEQG
jgi:hypothetical protein